MITQRGTSRGIFRRNSAVAQSELYAVYDEGEYNSRLDELYRESMENDGVFFCISKRIYRYLRNRPCVVPPLFKYRYSGEEVYREKRLPDHYIYI